MKKLLIWGLIGFVAYKLLKPQAKPMKPVIARPTDTLMPGSIGPAVEGVIKDGQLLTVVD